MHFWLPQARQLALAGPSPHNMLGRTAMVPWGESGA